MSGNESPAEGPSDILSRDEQKAPRHRDRKRVGFSDTAEDSRRNSQVPSETPSPGANQDTAIAFRPSHHRQTSDTERLSPELERELWKGVHAVFGQPYPSRPKPAIRKGGTASPLVPFDPDIQFEPHKEISGKQAQERAQKLADSQLNAESDEENRATEGLHKTASEEEANHLLQEHRGASHTASEHPLRSGQVTPKAEQDAIEDYVPKPTHYRYGILSTLLKLYGAQGPSSSSYRKHSHDGSRSGSVVSTVNSSPQHSPPASGATTPRKKHWYSKSPSSTSLSNLVGSSIGLASPIDGGFHSAVTEKLKKEKAKRPSNSLRSKSAGLHHALNRFGKIESNDLKIKVHLAEVISRHRYLMKLCRALMEYGAPMHRLEEYMRMSARVLEIEGQFLYIPGCMIISFDDSHTHTTEVKLVRASHGVNLGKLRDTHEIYKEVVHDQIGVDEAIERLEKVVKRKRRYSLWVLIPVYGLASASVGPFGFQARLIDLPVCFLLGCIVGILQLVVAPASDHYANVFEITAAVVTSFLARAFGSINGGNLFCFSALAQSSIALILPGYIVLCASLELQSRSMVAGSVRMVYAIIYSLFLGYGITIGSLIYGAMDKNATSATECTNPIPEKWYFLFVPIFTFCLIVINHGKWKQMPLMMLISLAGYVVNFFSAKRFVGNAQISNTLGALAIGFLANMHTRLGQRLDNWCLDVWELRIGPFFHGTWRLSSRHRSNSNDLEKQDSAHKHYRRRVGYGLAAAAMLPAIFVQVPSGLAANGSLVSGITSANQITQNATGTTTVSGGADSPVNSVAFNVGYSMIQVAIGISVGLFLSALFVYPLGKRRSGLFSF